MTAYATVAELSAYWRELSPEESARAAVLLDHAAAFVRAHCGGEPSDAEAARHVSCDMVKTAMLPSPFSAPVTSFQQSGGPYSANVTFANPAGDMYWKAQYDELLGLSGLSFACIKARTAFDD